MNPVWGWTLPLWELQAEGGGFEPKDYTEEAKKEKKKKKKWGNELPFRRISFYYGFISLL